MKLEAVDVRNPVMVRVATVVDRDEHRVKVHSNTITPPTSDPGSTRKLFERGIQLKQKSVTVINPTAKIITVCPAHISAEALTRFYRTVTQSWEIIRNNSLTFNL